MILSVMVLPTSLGAMLSCILVLSIPPKRLVRLFCACGPALALDFQGALSNQPDQVMTGGDDVDGFHGSMNHKIAKVR